MKCPFCGFANDKVVDSRESKEAESIRRRRECLKCGKRFTTYERIDEIPYMVVKKDGRREKFDRQKVLNGLLRACEKRPVPISKLEQIVNETESFVMEALTHADVKVRFVATDSYVSEVQLARYDRSVNGRLGDRRVSVWDSGASSLEETIDLMDRLLATDERDSAHARLRAV